jgi:Tfp pilus assembly protein PilZ
VPANRQPDDLTPRSDARRLVVRFATLEAFQSEYRRNIGNGGIFIETDEAFELREYVEVVLDLSWSDESVRLPGEIVNLRRGLARAGGVPGVAVQFLEAADELRQRIGLIAQLPPQATFHPTEERPRDERSASRARARVGARIASDEGTVRGRTVDLSASGMLVSIKGTPTPVGSAVHVALVHPTTGAELAVSGRVVRHLREPGGTTALGVEFDAAGESAAIEEFVESLHRADHARRLGAITGPIEVIGLPSLLQMFSSCAERGTLSVVRAAEEGAVGFESGTLRFARLGRARGVKAIARMFLWTEGSFEFHTYLDESEDPDPPALVYGVLMEAAQQVDEWNRADRRDLPPGVVLRPDRARIAPDDDSLGKLEVAVLDLLAAEAAPLESLLDALPDFDAEILGAVRRLLEAGWVRVRD